MSASATQTFINQNWKGMLTKQSSQFPGTGPSPDDQTMARAFMDQAYTHVANKAGRLMEDAFRLGFEIVKKNEATSKILAIFAFRVGRELLYVPVFFLNGMIRGTDLLHRYTPKRFVCLTPDWASYLIDQAITEQGASVPRSEASKIRDNVRMDRISWPPMQNKYAAADYEVILDEESGMPKLASADLPEGGWEKLLEDYCSPAENIPLLAPGFMAKSAAAYQGLIDEIEKSPAMADLLMRHFPEDHFFPEPEFTIEKKASAEEATAAGPSLKVHATSGDGIEKAASAGFFEKGYWIEDNRDTEKLAKVALPILEGMITIGGPGTYDVLTADGRLVRSLVGTCAALPEHNRRDYGIGMPCSSSSQECDSDRAKISAMRVLATDGSTLTRTDAGFMIYAQDVTDKEDIGINPKDMKAGSLYCLITPGGEITQEFMVRKVEAGKGGLKTFTISERGWDTHGQPLVFNPEADNELCTRAGVVNDQYRAMKLKETPRKPGANEPCGISGGEFPSMDWSVPTEVLGDPATVDAWLFGKLQLKKASVIYDRQEKLFQIKIQPGGNVLTPHEAAKQLVKRASLDPELYSLLAESDLVSGWEPRREIATKLAVCLQVPAPDAEAWLDAAVKSASAEHRILEYPDIEPGMTKLATIMPIQNNPPYELTGDPVHGVPVEIGPQIHNLAGSFGIPPDIRMQLGEVRDSGAGVVNQDGDDFLFHMPPDQLAQMASLKKMPHVLDHGIVGSLAQTYDASAVMDPILNDMERGLDGMARAIFLLLWKPADFRSMYGADDMPDLENKLNSIFKGLGDVLLDLLKKNRNVSNGSPPSI